jgi:hypothetical protein
MIDKIVGVDVYSRYELFDSVDNRSYYRRKHCGDNQTYDYYEYRKFDYEFYIAHKYIERMIYRHKLTPFIGTFFQILTRKLVFRKIRHRYIRHRKRVRKRAADSGNDKRDIPDFRRQRRDNCGDDENNRCEKVSREKNISACRATDKKPWTELSVCKFLLPPWKGTTE